MNSVYKAAMGIQGKDELGNEFSIVEDNGIRLKPKSSEKSFYIGRLSYKEGVGVLYLKNEKEKDRYRKFDSWSISWKIFQHVDMIYYFTEKDAYKISKADAETNGELLHMKGSPEKRMYVPVEFWTRKSEVINER